MPRGVPSAALACEQVSAFCEEAVRLVGTGAGAVPATPEKIPPLSSACKTRVERLPSPEWGALVTNINVAVSPPNWSTSPGKGRAAFEFIPITSAEEIGSPPARMAPADDLAPLAPAAPAS